MTINVKQGPVLTTATLRTTSPEAEFVFEGALNEPGYFTDMGESDEEGVKCAWEKLDQQLIDHFSLKLMQLFNDDPANVARMQEVFNDAEKYADFIERQVVIPYGRHRNRIQLR